MNKVNHPEGMDSFYREYLNVKYGRDVEVDLNVEYTDLSDRVREQNKQIIKLKEDLLRRARERGRLMEINDEKQLEIERLAGQVKVLTSTWTYTHPTYGDAEDLARMAFVNQAMETRRENEILKMEVKKQEDKIIELQLEIGLRSAEKMRLQGPGPTIPYETIASPCSCLHILPRLESILRELAATRVWVQPWCGKGYWKVTPSPKAWEKK